MFRRYFERHRFRDGRLLLPLVHQLINSQDFDMLDENIGGVVTILADQHNVDAVAGQYEAGNTADVVDPNRYGFSTILQQRRQ